MTSATRTTGNAYRCAVHAGTGPKVPGVRHVSIKASELEEAVTKAVVSAVFLAPTDGMPDGDTATLRKALRRRREISEQRTRLLDLMEGDSDVADIRARRAALKFEAEAMEQEINGIKSRNARVELLTDAHAALWAGGSVTFEDAAEVRRGIRHRFDALGLDAKRAIIGGMVSVVVHNGRGPGRIEITHLVALGLKEDRTRQHGDLASEPAQSSA